MVFGLRKLRAPQTFDENDPLRILLRGRDTSWYKGDLLRINLIIFFLIIASMSNGYDGSMMNGLQTLDQWKNYFNNPQGSTLGLFNAIQNIGTIVALPVAPLLNDRLGRRMTLFIGSLIALCGVAIQTAAQNVGMFIGCRFLIGFGHAWACIAAPVLITELAFPTHRVPLTSLYNSTWYLGSIVAAWTTFGTFRIESTWAWRIPSALQGLAPLIQVSLIWFFPESPRWLIDHGRDQEAIAILSKYHCGNNHDDPLITFEYEEIKEALRIEKEAANTSSYKAMFTKRGNLKRMRIIIALAFFSQWSGNGIVSYYLSIVLDGIGIKTEFEKNLYNGILQIYNLATAYMGALVVERAGRRTLFLTSTAGMCITFAIWTACSATYANSRVFDSAGEVISANRQAGNAVAGIIFIYYGFYNIALSPLLVSYTVEILPFRIRSKGLMIMQMCVSASLVFNQYVNPIALGALEWKYYIVYTIWIGFEFVYLYFTVIETKGKNGLPRPLEEIAALFDGEQAVADLQHETADAAGEKNMMGSSLAEAGYGEKKADGDEVHIEDSVRRL